MREPRRTIALDTTYSIGRNLSGVGVYSNEIANHLARAHPEARFLFCYRPHRYLRAAAVSSPNVRKRLLWNGWPARCDVFHGLNQRLDRRRDASVATFHDLFVMTGEYSTAEFRERFGGQAREAAARADLIVAVSEFTAQQVCDLLKVDRARIRVIPHGVYAAPATNGIERERVILFVGAIQKRKNVERLIKAFAVTPPGWRLVLAGSHGFDAEKILEAARESPRRNDIVATGYVTRSRLEELYASASIFAFPSLDEGFGIPVLEAMARGLPVLTSDRSALPEVAGDAALLVDPEDSDAISAGLNRLIADGGLRAELASRGVRRSAAYTWAKAAEATWHVYEELFN